MKSIKSDAGLHRLCSNVVNVSGDQLWAYKNRMCTGNGQIYVDVMDSHSTAQQNTTQQDTTQHKAVKCIPMCAAKKRII